jgi:superfamily II DNA or RNA helicase
MNSEKVICKKINEVYMKIECSEETLLLIKAYMTFEVPDAAFMRRKNKRLKFWDGKISLLDMRTRQIYLGLLNQVKQFCEFNDIEFVEVNCIPKPDKLDARELKNFIDSLDLENPPRDYQLEYFISCLKNQRKTVLSPTGSGKSLIIFLIAEWYKQKGKRVLVIVPTIHLVHQMKGDFIDYYPESEKYIHTIYQGQDKFLDAPITISTWQSIYELPFSFFEQYDVIFGDECHSYKADALQALMKKTVNTQYKFGTTGTLDGVECNRLILTGLFGEVEKLVSTSELIDSGVLAKLSIKCLILKYTKPDLKYYKSLGKDFQKELDYIVRHDKRSDIITRLVNSLKGNTLVLFQFVEKHGVILEEKISKECKDKKVYFIHGGVDGEERERIRKIVDTENNSVIVASYGTFSTGANIKNINNVVFASPSKSRIRVLQSIGRGLRKSSTKDSVILFDIVDHLGDNFALKHFENRVELYAEEGFPYSIIDIDM